MGLPAQSYAAHWVDYDNDGLTDLYVSPEGLYRQRPDRRFEATQLLERQYVKKGQIFSHWFDADNDGSRDFLVAVKEIPSIWKKVQSQIEIRFQNKRIFRSEKWHVMLYRNISAKDHWLQFQLVGSKGNRPALGAAVEVISPDGVQRQQVGQSEGSIRSHGHYRLYFGLGQHQQGIVAKIYWPDGHVQTLHNLALDQLVVIHREGLTVSRSN